MDAPRRLLQRAFLDTDARRREVHAPSHRPPQRRTDTVPALIVPLARWRTFWSHALRCSLENHKPRRRNTVYLDARGAAQRIALKLRRRARMFTNTIVIDRTRIRQRICWGRAPPASSGVRRRHDDVPFRMGWATFDIGGERARLVRLAARAVNVQRALCALSSSRIWRRSRSALSYTPVRAWALDHP